MCVDILLYFVLMHCSQPCFSLYCYPRCSPSPGLSFNFLCCDCFYLYIDGFYIWYVLLYINIVSVYQTEFTFAISHMHLTVFLLCFFFFFSLSFIISVSLFCQVTDVISFMKQQRPEMFKGSLVGLVTSGVVTDASEKNVFYYS